MRERLGVGSGLAGNSRRHSSTRSAWADSWTPALPEGDHHEGDKDGNCWKNARILGAKRWSLHSGGRLDQGAHRIPAARDQKLRFEIGIGATDVRILVWVEPFLWMEHCESDD